MELREVRYADEEIRRNSAVTCPAGDLYEEDQEPSLRTGNVLAQP